MKNTIRYSLFLLFIFTFLTGFIYPMLVTGIAQILFPWQANGSILKDNDGEQIGSQIIGQSFQDPSYFWSRPSATVDFSYNARASGGSNLSVMNQDLNKRMNERIEQITIADSDNRQSIPIDLITSSASGLDPHISPEAAFFQVKRVAHMRGLPEEQVNDLVENQIEQPTLFIFGEPRVNVLMLNIALDQLQYSK